MEKNCAYQAIGLLLALLLCHYSPSLAASSTASQLTISEKKNIRRLNPTCVGQRIYILKDTELFLSRSRYRPLRGILESWPQSIFNTEQISELALAPDCPPTIVVNPYIGGRVYRDIGQDGILTPGIDQPVANVTVSVYDDTGLVGTTTSSADGDYLFESLLLVGGAEYRIEFSGFSTDLEPSIIGGDNGTSVQFVTSNTCENDFGLTRPEEYVEPNPAVVTNCYLTDSNVGNTGDVLISLDFNTPSGINHESQGQQIGTTYGLAFSKQSGLLFASAFHKRFAGYGAGTPGSIYVITDPDDGAYSGGLFIDLNTLFGTNVAGTDVHDFTEVDVDPNPSFTVLEVIDGLSFDEVGRTSFGDMDITEDGDTLWVVNLEDRSLYGIPLGSDPINPVAPASSTEVEVIPLIGNLPGIPAGVSNNEIRPFALKYHQGKLYLGAVTNGETNGLNSMFGLAYSYDPGNGTFTKVLEFPLNYARGCAFAGNDGDGPECAGPAAWNPWLTSNAMPVPMAVPAGRLFVENGHPQPIFVDIEFDVSNNMIIGLRDRFGDQGGYQAANPDGAPTYDENGNTLIANSMTGQLWYVSDNDAFGDLLLATPSGGGWSVNITDFTDSSLSLPNSVGGMIAPCPDGENFFREDCYSADGFLHEETSMGGIALLQRDNIFSINVMDPELNAYSNGIDWHNPATGLQTMFYTVLNTPGESVFGKGNGLGDMELITAPAPIEIGNRLWLDNNVNGIQDPGEAGINGVLVELYKDIAGVMTKVAETTTSTDPVQGDGAFKFTNSTEQTWSNGQTEVLRNMDYEIRVSLADVQAVEPTVLTFVPPNATGDNSNSNRTDLVDSDADLNGVIAFATGGMGENNHTLDIGVSAMLDCSITVNSAVPSVCDPATNTYSVDVAVTYANAPAGEMITITTDNGASQSFSPAGTDGTQTFTLTGLTSDGVANINVTATYATTTTCTDDLVDGYTAPADCTPFDLALVKRLDTGATPGPYTPGGTVTFEIEVYNQGDIDATDIEVKDYVPDGLTLAAASAADWSVTVDTATLINPISLSAGDSTILSISFTIDEDFMLDTLVNRAEISNFDDDGDPLTDPPVDEDSTPNDNGTDDPEVDTPDEYADDNPDAPGTEDDPNDEDDYDWEGIAVLQSFDLNLIKRIDTDATPGPFTYGSTVAFIIEVRNQGTLDATGVEVADYVPAGLTLVPSTDWTMDVDTARLTMPFDLAAGDTASLSISFTIDNDFNGTTIDNVAEISAATNALGRPDEDSTPGDNGNTPPEVDTDDEDDDDGPNGNGNPDDPADADDFDLARISMETVSLGSTVFVDENNDGLQNGADAGISGVEVQLWDAMTMTQVLTNASGARVLDPLDAAPTLTDGAGNYHFTNLVPGDYYVVIPVVPGTLPISSNNSGIAFAETDPDDNVDNDDEGLQPGGSGTAVTSNTISLSLGAEPITGTSAMEESGQGNLQDDAFDSNGNMTLDFGFFAPVSVGDTAFVDLNNDGLQTPGEPGIAGVTVTVYDNGTGGVVSTDAEGNPYNPVTMTGADGSYAFENLPPGDYYVIFDPSTADDAQFYAITTQNAGNDADDSDADPTTGQTAPTGFLLSGQSDPTLDVGVFCNVIVTVADPATICASQVIDLTQGASISPASLGGTWSTPDGTGTFDGGTDFATATTYTPSAEDRQRRSVTLVLTTNNPAGLCGAVSAQVTFQILNVDCGTFPWDGN